MSFDPNKVRIPEGSAFVLVMVDPEPKVSGGGIVIPETSEAKVEEVARGRGMVLQLAKKYFPRWSKKTIMVSHDLVLGDRVIFRGFLKNANYFKDDNNNEYCFLHVDDVLAVIEEG